jgi:methionyl-tRNA formyltransferase
MLNILLAGQKWFGAAVFKELVELDGVRIVAVSCPYTTDEKKDRLFFEATRKDIPTIQAGTLNADTMPDGVDLIVTAHSHDFIGEKTRLRATYGGIGYHPSLLPLHRGRDAVQWTVRMGDKVSGGTVYKLSNQMDGGDILLQQHVLINPKTCTAESLWREELAPLGVRLISQAVAQIAEAGSVVGEKQDESLASWEPSIDRPPAFRPDLMLLSYERD